MHRIILFSAICLTLPSVCFAQQRPVNLPTDVLPHAAVKRYGETRFRTGSAIRQIEFGEQIVAASSVNGAYVWAYPSGDRLAQFSGWQLSGTNSLSSNGKFLCLARESPKKWMRSHSKEIRVVDLSSGKDLLTLPLEKSATTTAWVPGQSRLLVGFNDGSVDQIDFPSGQSVGKLGDSAGKMGSGSEKKEGATNDAGQRKIGINTQNVGQSWIARIVVSPNGKTVFVQHSTWIGLWDLESGERRFLVKCTNRPVTAKIATDNSTLWFASEFARTDVARLQSFSIGPDAVLSNFDSKHRHAGTSYEEQAAFSPDGTRLVITGAGRNSRRLRTEILVFDSSKPESALKTLGPMRGEVAVAFSLDGKVIAAGGNGNVIRFWDAKSFEELNQSNDHIGSITALAVSADEKWLATSGSDNQVLVREISTGKLLHTLETDVDDIHALEFSPDIKTIFIRAEIRRGERKRGNFVGTPQQVIYQRGIVSGDQILEIDLQGKWRGPLSVSKDGKRIAGTVAGETRIINFDSNKEMDTPTIEDSLSVVSGLRYYAVNFGGKNKNEEVFPSLVAPSSKSKSQYQPDYPVWPCGGFNSVADQVVLGKREALGIYSAADNSLIKSLGAMPDLSYQKFIAEYRHAAFFPDGKRVLAIRDVDPYRTSKGTAYGLNLSQQQIEVWDVASGVNLRKLVGHDGGITDFAFAEDGRAVFTSGVDGSVLLWDFSISPPSRKTPTTVSEICKMMFDERPDSAVDAMRSLVESPDQFDEVLTNWRGRSLKHTQASKLIEKLENPDLGERIKAIAELAQISQTTPAVESLFLKKILESKTPDDVQLRLQILMEGFSDTAANDFIHLQRVIKVSEWIADDDSRKRLQLFADWLPIKRGGTLARDALKRIEKGNNRVDYDALPQRETNTQSSPIQATPLKLFSSPAKK